MKPDKRFEYKTTFWSFVAIIVMLLGTAIWNKCSAQMTIPLVSGTVEEGNVLTPGGGSGELFTLYESTMDASTTEVRIDFRHRRYERPSELTYPIDSIDISESMQDGYEKITLWTSVDFSLDNAEKVIIFTNGITYRMYIYYPEQIFYFSGKVH